MESSSCRPHISRIKTSLLIVAAVLALLFGCDSKYAIEEQRALASAFEIIPIAKQLKELYPHGYYKAGGLVSPLGATFDATVPLWQRYILHVRVHITVSSGRVVKYEPATFMLEECKQIVRNGPNGRYSVDSADVGQFLEKRWNRVFEAKGDFSAIGFLLVTNNPVEGFSEYWANTHFR